MQSVPITTDGVSLNLDQGEVYWNIVESGVKHHQTNNIENQWLYTNSYSKRKKKMSVMAVTGQISIEIGHLSNMTLILSQ